MGADFFVLKSLELELRNLLIGGRVASCMQTHPKSLGLFFHPSFRNKPDVLVLFDANLVDIVVLNDTALFQPSKTLLVRSFQNKISGGRVTSVEVPYPDRLLVIELQTSQWKHPRKIYFEMHTRPANVVAVDSGSEQIMECLTKMTSIETNCQVRQPGIRYYSGLRTENKDNARTLEEITQEYILDILSKDNHPSRVLLDQVKPITPDLAKKLISLAKSTDAETFNSFRDTVVCRYRTAEFVPRVICDKSRCRVDVMNLAESPESFSCETTIDALKTCFCMSVQERELSDFRSVLTGVVNRIISRVQKTIIALHDDLSGLDDPGKLRHDADLLMANYHRIKPGMRELTVRDLYHPDQIDCLLKIDPSVPLRKFINSLYKKAGKIDRARPAIQTRLRLLDQRRMALSQFQEAILAAGNTADLRSIETGLMESGYISKSSSGQSSRRRLEARIRPPYMEFHSPEGFQIWVGRGARDNDETTFHRATKDDFWLHAKDYHGAHVIIKNPSKLKAPPEKTVIQAARLAVYFSKARGEKSVTVMITRRHQVRKASGGTPGLVHVHQHQTVIVDSPPPDEIEITSFS